MKKAAPYIILFLLALLLWDIAIDTGFMHWNIDGYDFGDPLGALLALVFAGGGIIIAGLVMLVVGVALAAMFAGLGVLVLGTLVVVAAMVALALSPLLLPLLVPVAIIWYLVSRSRQRQRHIAPPAA